MDACAARGIQVVHTPDANTQAVVEYVMSIMTHMFRPLHGVHASSTPVQWAERRVDAMASRQLSELQLGVLGMGRIGRRVAQVAGALGMRVHFCDLLDIEEVHRHGAVPVDQDRLLRASDVVSVHVDGRASNRHLLQASTLAMLKPDALLINTSRGFVIEHDDLAVLLADRPDMRAVLDVHDPEPIGPDNPLLNMTNATLLPHAASRTAAAQVAMSAVVRDVARVLGLPLD
jgi:D-3-phosphoglycerate dehydrogenase